MKLLSSIKKILGIRENGNIDSGYHPTHYGRPGQWGGSSPRGEQTYDIDKIVNKKIQNIRDVYEKKIEDATSEEAADALEEKMNKKIANVSSKKNRERLEKALLQSEGLQALLKEKVKDTKRILRERGGDHGLIGQEVVGYQTYDKNMSEPVGEGWSKLMDDERKPERIESGYSKEQLGYTRDSIYTGHISKAAVSSSYKLTKSIKSKEDNKLMNKLLDLDSKIISKGFENKVLNTKGFLKEGAEKEFVKEAERLGIKDKEVLDNLSNYIKNSFNKGYPLSSKKYLEDHLDEIKKTSLLDKKAKTFTTAEGRTRKDRAEIKEEAAQEFLNNPTIELKDALEIINKDPQTAKEFKKFLATKYDLYRVRTMKTGAEKTGVEDETYQQQGGNEKFKLAAKRTMMDIIESNDNEDLKALLFSKNQKQKEQILKNTRVASLMKEYMKQYKDTPAEEVHMELIDLSKGGEKENFKHTLELKYHIESIERKEASGKVVDKALEEGAKKAKEKKKETKQGKDIQGDLFSKPQEQTTMEQKKAKSKIKQIENKQAELAKGLNKADPRDTKALNKIQEKQVELEKQRRQLMEEHNIKPEARQEIKQEKEPKKETKPVEQKQKSKNEYMVEKIKSSRRGRKPKQETKAESKQESVVKEKRTTENKPQETKQVSIDNTDRIKELEQKMTDLVKRGRGSSSEYNKTMKEYSKLKQQAKNQPKAEPKSEAKKETTQPKEEKKYDKDIQTPTKEEEPREEQGVKIEKLPTYDYRKDKNTKPENKKEEKQEEPKQKKTKDEELEEYIKSLIADDEDKHGINREDEDEDYGEEDYNRGPRIDYDEDTNGGSNSWYYDNYDNSRENSKKNTKKSNIFDFLKRVIKINSNKTNSGMFGKLKNAFLRIKTNSGTASSGDWGHKGAPGSLGGSTPVSKRKEYDSYQKGRQKIGAAISEYIKTSDSKSKKDVQKFREKLEKDFSKRFGREIEKRRSPSNAKMMEAYEDMDENEKAIFKDAYKSAAKKSIPQIKQDLKEKSKEIKQIEDSEEDKENELTLRELFKKSRYGKR